MELRVETPFPEYAVPRIWIWMQEFRGRVLDDFAPKDLPGFMAEWAQRQAAGQQTWVVYRDGEPGGLVTFEVASPVAGWTHCLFSRRFWGQDTTIPALQRVYRQIFETTQTRKLCALAFADNFQVIGLARRLGAKREGLLRQQTTRGGKAVDMVVLGLLREEFDAKCSTGSVGGNAGEQRERPDADHNADGDDGQHRNDAAPATA
jgi:RimJ/RimL family protein N-acetyltransferase